MFSRYQLATVLVLHCWRSCTPQHATCFFVSRKAEQAVGGQQQGVVVCLSVCVCVLEWGGGGVFPRETTGTSAVRSGKWQLCRSAGPPHGNVTVSGVAVSFPTLLLKLPICITVTPPSPTAPSLSHTHFSLAFFCCVTVVPLCVCVCRCTDARCSQLQRQQTRCQLRPA